MEANESTFMKMWKSYRTIRNVDRKVKHSEETRTNRRSTRNSIALRRRNIGVLTPINSPCPDTQIVQVQEPSSSKPPTNKDKKPINKSQNNNDPRLQLLKKWQEEKSKRELHEKSKTKPVFKVQRVVANTTYNLDKVYTEIKGKPIGALLKQDNKKGLRPIKSHKFKAPVNVEPIDTKIDNKTSRKGLKNTRNLMKGKLNFLDTTKSDNSVINLRSRKVNKNIDQTSKNHNEIIVLDTQAQSSRSVFLASKQRKLDSPLNLQPLTISGDLHDVPARKSATRRSSRIATPKIVENYATENQKDHVKEKKKNKKIDKSLKSTNQNSLELSEEATANSSQLKTPDNTTDLNKSVGHCYISPFVTVSRGSENARKEYRQRLLRSPMSEELNKSNSPKAAVQYFNMIVNSETERLLLLCEKWNNYKLENTTEEVGDMINVAVGQTDLLLNKKFKQFRGLIQCCETGQSEKPVTCLDLHGFWDTMKLQADNLDKRFEYLDKLKENNWEEIAPIPKVTKKTERKKYKSKKVKPSSLRAMIEERRRKLAEEPSVCAETNVGEQVSQTPSKRRSSRIYQISSASKRRLSSPGLTMMKVTQAAKLTEQNQNHTTPGDKMITVQQPKSILRSEPRRSIRKSKAVLFKDSPEIQQENNRNVPNIVSPYVDVDKTRRSSRRLSKRNLN